MAKFLTTTGVSYCLEEIIRNASERLVLISPFLRINERIRELLEDKNRMKIDIRVIYGKNELHQKENDWLKSLTYIRTGFCKNLHAKCYLNNEQALLTSMNLYEFSQVNNNEMGIHVLREGDPELYDEILSEAMRIVRISEDIDLSAAKTIGVKKNQRNTKDAKTPRQKTAKKQYSSRSTLKELESGFCIRCSESVAIDPGKPHCERCYRQWNRYKNNEYKEKHCHVCGSEHQTTVLKPVCIKCYRKYKKILTFPEG